MAANDDLEAKLKAGIEAARRGDRATARRLLEQVVQADDSNELAWMWLASSVNTLSERRACLERVLQINPNNPRAREALQKLTEEERRARGEDTAAAEQLRRIEQARAQRPAASPARPAPPPPPRPVTEGGSRINLGYVVAVGFLVIGIIALGFFASSVLNQPQPTPTQFIFAPTDTETSIPPSPTPYLVDPSTRTAPTLPPTFTPTATYTPSITPSPTITPYPVAEFSLYFTSLSVGEVQPSLSRINADGTGEEFVVGEVRELAFDPSARKVVFVRDVTVEPDERSPEGGIFPEIFVAPADNFNAAVKITDLRASRTGGPKWGPDALQIVFSTNYDGDEEIWTMTDDGQNVRQMTNNESIIDRDPAWSPDGSTIVFASDRDSPGFTEIYAMLASLPEGTDNPVTRLTDAANSSYAPSWSADGSKIAFVSDRESGDGDIYIMDANGDRPILLVYDTDTEDRSPSISPDLRYVAFISNREDDLFQTYLVTIATREITRVTNNGQDNQTVVFLPNILLSLR